MSCLATPKSLVAAVVAALSVWRGRSAPLPGIAPSETQVLVDREQFRQAGRTVFVRTCPRYPTVPTYPVHQPCPFQVMPEWWSTNFDWSKPLAQTGSAIFSPTNLFAQILSTT